MNEKQKEYDEYIQEKVQGKFDDWRDNALELGVYIVYPNTSACCPQCIKHGFTMNRTKDTFYCKQCKKEGVINKVTIDGYREWYKNERKKEHEKYYNRRK